MSYSLTSHYKPTGDQPRAIEQLIAGLKKNERAQVLLGVTGSGKTFTMANVIAEMRSPIADLVTGLFDFRVSL